MNATNPDEIFEFDGELETNDQTQESLKQPEDPNCNLYISKIQFQT